MSLVTEEIKGKADEVYYGDEICREKTRLLLREVGLPNGLLPLKDIEEVGYVKETGFVWLKQKKSITHKFEKIGKLVSYAKEVTAIVEKNKVKNLTGVKAKELLIWLTLSQIYVDDPPTGKITFQIPTGLSRCYPVAAFEVEEVVKETKEEEKKNEVKETNEEEQKNEVKETNEVKEKIEVKETNEVKEKIEGKNLNEVNKANGAALPVLVKEV